jgi:hypothetical protein
MSAAAFGRAGAERERGEAVMLCTLTHVCRTVGGKILVGVEAKHCPHTTASMMRPKQTRRLWSTPFRRASIPGIPSFFEKRLDERAQQPTAVEAFFSTHPTDQSRVAATQRQIAGYAPARERTLLRDSPEFHASQAHVRSLPSPASHATSSPP